MEGSDVGIGTEVMKVRAETLDDYFDSRQGVVKVDVEGEELHVLRGAKELLFQGRLHWIVEAHSKELTAAITWMLREAGYVCRVLDSDSDDRSHVIATPDQVRTLASPESR